MKKYLWLVGMLFIFNSANAAGCLKGAAVGAVAGHVAGHHTVLGAVGRCIVGRQIAKNKAKQDKEFSREKKHSVS